MKIRKWISAALLGAAIACAWAMPEAAAATRTVEATGMYVMEKDDTRIDAKEAAVKDALRIAAEEAGAYIQSRTEMQGGELTSDEVRSIAAHLLRETATTYTWQIEGNGKSFICHAHLKASFEEDAVDAELQKRAVERRK